MERGYEQECLHEPGLYLSVPCMDPMQPSPSPSHQGAPFQLDCFGRDCEQMFAQPGFVSESCEVCNINNTHLSLLMWLAV